MLKRLLLLWMVFPVLLASGQEVPIGTWQEHLPWRQALFAGAYGNQICCVTRSGLFYVSPANELHRLHKMNGLSATGITAAGMEPASGKVVLVYSDGGIDIVDGNEAAYLPDLKLAAAYPDKHVNAVSCHRNRAYLATTFGIVVLDLARNETEDTWLPSAGGTAAPVYYVLPGDDLIYAAVPNGVLRAPASSPNLADFVSWERIPGLPQAPFQSLARWNNFLLAASGNTLFRENNDAYSVFYSGPETITSVRIINNRIAVVEKTRIVLLDDHGAVTDILTGPTALPQPRDVTFFNGDWWVADIENGLQKSSGSNWVSFTPNGPYDIIRGSIALENIVPGSIVPGNIVHTGSKLAAAAGTILPDGTGAGNRSGLSVYENGSWSNHVPGSGNIPAGITDISAVSISSNGNIYAGSAGSGLLELRPNGEVTVFRESAGLPPLQADPSRYPVHGLFAGQGGSIWIAASGAAAPIAFLEKNAITTLSPPFFLQGNRVAQLLEDAGKLWIVSPGNGLLLLDHNYTPGAPGDDRWRLFRAGQGNGNLPDNMVHCVAKDRNGFIWIGTDKGIGVVQCPTEAISAQCEATLPIVQQDNFAGYLFRNETVKAIAVDGANRKWVGTGNGLWLINAEGDKVISRFTEENSPLLSDSIFSLAINGTDGTVFVATAKGLCSFRSTATTAGEAGFSARVFPNPVPPGYHGTIAIRDIPRDAIVKITEPNGRLVFQTKALGGQAVWNGLDYRGNRVASGVYLVLVTNEERKENLAGKIVIVR